jgi:hypothetical protein
LLDLLIRFLNRYRTDNPDERVEFVNSIKVKDGLYPVSSIVNLNNINDAVNEDVQQERVYTVEEGDAPYTIAKKNDVFLRYAPSAQSYD